MASDEALARVATMIEELGSRFDIVVEAASGFAGRLDKLRDEVFAQFAEVGGQVRFLSEQIAENRSSLSALRADFGAEMARLGEALGHARVESREQLAAVETSLRNELAAPGGAAAGMPREEAARREAASGRRTAGEGSAREAAAAMRELRREIAASAESAVKRLSAEIKVTNRALVTLGRKFERFDDRVTIQIRDQEQRLKKAEARGRR